MKFLTLFLMIFAMNVNAVELITKTDEDLSSANLVNLEDKQKELIKKDLNVEQVKDKLPAPTGIKIKVREIAQEKTEQAKDLVKNNLSKPRLSVGIGVMTTSAITVKQPRISNSVFNDGVLNTSFGVDFTYELKGELYRASIHHGAYGEANFTILKGLPLKDFENGFTSSLYYGGSFVKEVSVDNSNMNTVHKIDGYKTLSIPIALLGFDRIAPVGLVDLKYTKSFDNRDYFIKGEIGYGLGMVVIGVDF